LDAIISQVIRMEPEGVGHCTTYLLEWMDHHTEYLQAVSPTLIQRRDQMTHSILKLSFVFLRQRKSEPTSQAAMAFIIVALNGGKTSRRRFSPDTMLSALHPAMSDDDELWAIIRSASGLTIDQVVLMLVHLKDKMAHWVGGAFRQATTGIMNGDPYGFGYRYLVEIRPRPDKAGQHGQSQSTALITRGGGGSSSSNSSSGSGGRLTTGLSLQVDSVLEATRERRRRCNEILERLGREYNIRF